MTFFTVIAKYRAVKLQDSLTSGGLMQSIDILCYYSTYWVMTAFNRPSASHSASFLWAAFG